MISAYIIEDEIFAREELKHQLSVYSDIIIVGEAKDAISAISEIKTIKPELIFLDIEMPGMKGLDFLDVLSTIQSYLPYVIVVTAYENYALKAFEYNVVDYLLKPINTKRLAEAISRVLKYKNYSMKENIKKIVAKKGTRIILISIPDISYAFVENTSVFVCSAGTKYMTNYRSLDELENDIKSSDFFRTHRAYIVNLKNILEIKNTNTGNMFLKLKDFDEEIPVSRNKSKDLKSILNL